jgi:hypothetical protein
MTLILTPEFDPTCRHLANFLAGRLNLLEADETVVQTALDYDAMIGAQGVAFPLLQVYRMGSSSVYLEKSDINIDYYLYDLQAYWQRPGILRLVEVAIAHLIQDNLPYSGLEPEIQVKVKGCDRGYVKFESGEIFPYTRLSAELQEVNVKLPS